MKMVCIIIVNYRGGADTASCLEAVLGLQNLAFRVLIVDNASGDDSEAIVRSWAEQIPPTRYNDKAATLISCVDTSASDAPPESLITWIRNQHNSGYAGGNNVGIRLALAHRDCGYVWLLNNDTLPTPRSGCELVSAAGEVGQPSIVGSTLVYEENPDIVQATGVSYNVRTTVGRELSNGEKLSTLKTPAIHQEMLTYLPGASLLVTRSFLEKVGLLNESFFLYYEELDWCVRARRFDVLPKWVPSSVVIHKEGGSIGTSARGNPSRLSRFHMTRSMMIFYRPIIADMSSLPDFVSFIR